MKRVIGILLVGTTAFAGGVIAGLLLTPKSGRENRLKMREYGKETKSWLEERRRKLKEEGEQRIDRLSKGIKKTVKGSVPDLYEATEELHFSEEEEIEQITKNG